MSTPVRSIVAILLLATVGSFNTYSEEAIVDPELSAEWAEKISPNEDETKTDFKAGIQLWYSMGHGEWEIEFGALFIKGRSLLEWEDIDAPVVVIHGEGKINDEWSVGGSVGYGNINDGQNTDGDWIEGFQFSESMAETDGNVKLGDINGYYQVVDDKVDGRDFTMDLFGGIQYYKDSLNDQDGVQTIVDERPVNEPFPGLDSKYRFEWTMLRLGTRGELVLNDTVTLNASLAYLLLLDYSGEAFWNLRDDYRNEDPNFEHDSSSGFGYEAKISAEFQVAENVFLNVGYWYLIMEADDGTDTIYLADGSTEKTDLTNVESERHGAFGGALIKF